MDRALFDEEFLRSLESLAFLSRRVRGGRFYGEHPSFRKGTSPDFADYRSYQPGDDFRSIDWNVWSRLGRPYVKLYREEEDLSVHVLLDASLSMDWGRPRKIDYARRLAAALAYIGLSSLDRVGVTAFAGGLGDTLPAHRGRSQMVPLFEYMSRIRPAGGTAFSACLADYALRCSVPGLAVVVSDLLDEGGVEKGLAALLYRRFDVVLIQVLDSEEIEPTGSGPVRLRDAESGRSLRLTLDPALEAAYRRRFREWLDGIESFCLSHQVEYLRASTLVPFEDVVLRYLRQGTHLRGR